MIQHWNQEKTYVVPAIENITQTNSKYLMNQITSQCLTGFELMTFFETLSKIFNTPIIF